MPPHLKCVGTLAYSVKCQTTHLNRRRHWPVAWLTLIEPGMWAKEQPGLTTGRLCCWGCSSTD